MEILLIDNYDSYTYNLAQLVAQVSGRWPAVVANDAIPFADLAAGRFDGVVISPGPGAPERAGDFGDCERVIRGAGVPILGVCLGHQGIASAFGGSVGLAPAPVHGQVTTVEHDGSEMFRGIPRRFSAVRYHSLAVTAALPSCLRATAWSEDGVVMAIAHVGRPIWGVQFHPESVGTPDGKALVENFLGQIESPQGEPRRPRHPRRDAGAARPPAENSLVARTIDHLPDPPAAFRNLFGRERYAFWLDGIPGEGFGSEGLSFMGAAGGPGGEVLSCRTGEGVTASEPARGRSERQEGTIFAVLRQRLAAARIDSGHPFGLTGGYVGYLGYELKADLGMAGRHRSELPDAQLMRARCTVVLDHLARQCHVLGIVDADSDRSETESEVDSLCRELLGVPVAAQIPTEEDQLEATAGRSALSAGAYGRSFDCAQRHLRAGDSYEVCLTNQFEFALPDGFDPLDLYERQRLTSPAPYGAYLRFGDLSLSSSSPERFLRITNSGSVRTSPIKGTRKRGEDPAADSVLRGELAASPKERAENMMIVDLLRNDLGRVCETGSVEVTSLMAVETFAHAHQLVTHIEGRLRADSDAIDCVESCFPGGSMTGAPKRRTIEILDSLEARARGPYSGALGYFGPDGSADLGIVIRSIVIDGDRAAIGAGGAVTVLSDAEEELAEMVLKANPLASLLLGDNRWLSLLAPNSLDLIGADS